MNSTDIFSDSSSECVEDWNEMDDKAISKLFIITYKSLLPFIIAAGETGSSDPASSDTLKQEEILRKFYLFLQTFNWLKNSGSTHEIWQIRRDSTSSPITVQTRTHRAVWRLSSLHNRFRSLFARYFTTERHQQLVESHRHQLNRTASSSRYDQQYWRLGGPVDFIRHSFTHSFENIC